MNIQSALKQACTILRNNNIKSANLDSEVLMSHVIKKDKKYIILNHNKELQPKNICNFKKLINQRANGKPIAYLMGKKEFWNYEFILTNDVLIPRPETELIVEQVLKISKNKSKLKFLEIGVGSGCIILSILREKKDFQGIGIDINKKCIDVSKSNAFKLGVSNRVKFYKSDIDNFDKGKYDLIISNPPYIKKIDLQYLEKDVINFEPKNALNGGLDGTSEIRKVISKSSELIKKNGKLILEIAFDQKEKVKKILNNEGFYINQTLKDLAKKDRCIVSTKL